MLAKYLDFRFFCVPWRYRAPSTQTTKLSHRPNQPAGYAAFNQAGPPPDASNTELQGRPALPPRKFAERVHLSRDRNPAWWAGR